MVRLGVVGLGKMGVSHLSIARAHPDVEIVAVCDSSSYALSILQKYTGLRTFSSYEKMLSEAKMDALIIATPSRSHSEMVKLALDCGLHVFCEKPFCLNPNDSSDLSRLASVNKLCNQVGYHNRFVGAFSEVRKLLDNDAIGQISHIRAEAHGPVVLKSQGSTWRSQKSEGGGCLYDYAAHPLNLMTWYLGEPTGIKGSILNSVFSRDTDDEVYSTLEFVGGISGHLSVNWSDESQRKMTTRIAIWGRNGKIVSDRQECQVFLRDASRIRGYRNGWNVRYTTELTDPVWFYLRGEEYSAQIDYFIESISLGRLDGINSFSTASETDHVLSQIIRDASSTSNAPTSIIDENGGSPSWIDIRSSGRRLAKDLYSTVTADFRGRKRLIQARIAKS